VVSDLKDEKREEIGSESDLRSFMAKGASHLIPQSLSHANGNLHMRGERESVRETPRALALSVRARATEREKRKLNILPLQPSFHELATFGYVL
jgi:hypothetical protein